MGDQTQSRANFAKAYTDAAEKFMAGLETLLTLDTKAQNAGYTFVDGDFVSGGGSTQQLDANTLAAVRSTLSQLNAVGFQAGASTTLNGAITNNATTLVVASNAGFPIGIYGFVVTIDSEQLFVVSNAGTTWTVLRGVNGTAAAAHNNAAAVAMATRIATLTKARP